MLKKFWLGLLLSFLTYFIYWVLYFNLEITMKCENYNTKSLLMIEAQPGTYKSIFNNLKNSIYLYFMF